MKPKQTSTPPATGDPGQHLPLAFDSKSAAAMLSISVKTLNRLVNSGQLKPMNTPYRGRYFSQRALLDFIERCST